MDENDFNHINGDGVSQMKDKLGILLFTVIEVETLIIWLFVAREVNQILAIAILFVGLLLEHIVQYNIISLRGFFNLNSFPILSVGTFTLLETFIWVVWLLLSGYSLVIAGAFLFAGLIIEHTGADNVFKAWILSTFKPLVKIETIGFILIEALGGTLWLFFVLDEKILLGIGVLSVGSITEHIQEVRLGRMP